MNEKNISAVTIWKDGVSNTAEVFSLRSVGDDLATSATFCFELKDVDGNILTTGNITMDNTEYEDWNANPDINTAAYIWAAVKLNLTII